MTVAVPGFCGTLGALPVVNDTKLKVFISCRRV